MSSDCLSSEKWRAKEIDRERERDQKNKSHDFIQMNILANKIYLKSISELKSINNTLEMISNSLYPISLSKVDSSYSSCLSAIKSLYQTKDFIFLQIFKFAVFWTFLRH